MASFKYDAYAAQREAQKSTNPNGGLGPEVHFLNAYLKEDGDVVVVRFPYRAMADLTFETTHSITLPNKRYPSRVRCVGDGCPFCAQGIKLDTRFFAKLIAYVVDETSGDVKLLNAVWDRPAAFADIDVKNLMQEYGDISNYLFKIKRNGSGTATRYTISIVMNNTVYNPAIYKADFTELDKVDPVKILSKSLEQYNEALNPSANNQAKTAPAAQTAPAQTATAPAQATQPSPAAQPAPIAQQPAAQPSVSTPDDQQRRTTRYQF